MHSLDEGKDGRAKRGVVCRSTTPRLASRSISLSIFAKEHIPLDTTDRQGRQIQYCMNFTLENAGTSMSTSHHRSATRHQHSGNQWTRPRSRHDNEEVPFPRLSEILNRSSFRLYKGLAETLQSFRQLSPSHSHDRCSCREAQVRLPEASDPRHCHLLLHTIQRPASTFQEMTWPKTRGVLPGSTSRLFSKAGFPITFA